MKNKKIRKRLDEAARERELMGLTLAKLVDAMVVLKNASKQQPASQTQLDTLRQRVEGNYNYTIEVRKAAEASVVKLDSLTEVVESIDDCLTALADRLETVSDMLTKLGETVINNTKLIISVLTEDVSRRKHTRSRKRTTTKTKRPASKKKKTKARR